MDKGEGISILLNPQRPNSPPVPTRSGTALGTNDLKPAEPECLNSAVEMKISCAQYTVQGLSRRGERTWMRLRRPGRADSGWYAAGLAQLVEQPPCKR